LPRIIPVLIGRTGRVEIPELGSSIGEVVNWTARRRAEKGPEAELDDLNIVFGWIQRELYDDPEYEKVIVLRMNRHNAFRVEQDPGGRAEFVGKYLNLEKVRLVKVE